MIESEKLLTKAEVERSYGLNFCQIETMLKPNGTVYDGWTNVPGYLRSRVEAVVIELRKAQNERIGKKKCGGCGRWKFEDDFYLLDNYCRKCRQKANRRKRQKGTD